jgi:DNA invertase Pin-like site-specific DNA recombinase
VLPSLNDGLHCGKIFCGSMLVYSRVLPSFNGGLHCGCVVGANVSVTPSRMLPPFSGGLHCGSPRGFLSQTAGYETPGHMSPLTRQPRPEPISEHAHASPASEMVNETLASVAAVHHNLVGLARVSTDAQDAQLQRDALTEAGCGRIFEEKISTRKTERPGLAAALDYLRPADTLCVWKLDRLGRSVKNVLIIADDLHDRGIGLRILTGKLADTYTPSGEGKFFFTMMAAFAELERDIIHERTMAGLAAARAQGRTGGRPTVMNGDKLAAARARRANGESPAQIARALGVSRASIYRHLAIPAGS